MKVVHSLFGNVALHVSADEVVPANGVVIQDFINFVGNTYQFGIRPQLQATGVIPIGQQLIFQNGILIDGQKRLPIAQIASVTNGDIVTAATTEIAEAILLDYMKQLDSALGYRFASANTEHRTFQSNLVVQFDAPLEEQFDKLLKMEAIITKEIPRSFGPFKLKRIALGYGDVPQVLSLETIEKTDFLIERRASEPYSQNRYFCSAPTTTKEHIRILETLERELSK
jgi:hypothetical protein